MAADVGRERHLQSHHFADFLQVAVHVVLHLLVLPPFRPVGTGDDGQQVGAVGGQVGIGVHDVLHGRFPAHGQGLSGFLAAVLQQAVPQVGLLYVGHVDERHALQVDAQHEHVAREGQCRARSQVEPLDGPDGTYGHGALGGPGEAGEDVAEDVFVGSQPHADCLAVERAQGAQVARRRVAFQSAAFQPGLVEADVLFAERVGHQVLAPAEEDEAVQRVAISLCGARPANPCLFVNHVAYEAKPCRAVRQPFICRHQVVRRIFQPGRFLFRHHVRQPLDVPLELRGPQLQLRLPFTCTGDPYGGGHFVPFVRLYMVIRINGSRSPSVNHQEKQSAFLSLRRRGTEF